MPTTFEEAFAAIKKLAADFRANEANFISPAYQEQEARNDFINKFFFALGWDVYHDLQKNPFQQEVKLERGVAMGASERRADYAFYVAPHFRRDNVRFFAEAKKPAGEIATPDNCFQTIRYGANAGTPLAVLTNFRQLAVLDSRYKPKIDTATKKVVRLYDYADYADAAKFREIFHLLSRDAVADGSLETFAESLPSKRGKAAQRDTGEQPIGDAFLQELDTYRGTLARAFKNRNPGLDGETLTEITQRTLDRLVFLRFLEDKLIETKESVASFGRRGSAWNDFVAASRRLNGIYNGVVFRHHDRLDSPDFQVDDGIFVDVCHWLSDPYSSYDFDKIPIHILGSIYERFLGNVIVTTDKRARVEEKPEVRKAGGVYYTPDHIVRYIVENTVGKLIEGKTPAQIAEMRFADIACGSGSFLLGVFDLLLHYHRDWFNANPDKAKKAGCVPDDNGAWHLSLKQRREILLNNIYGVDIDHQAVEVAQLSLYLKLLEEETTASAHDYQLEFHETLLPTLNKNIVCGNSLIGTDILTGQLFEPVEEKKLNPMDYEQRFPEIMKRGGFDVVVGNPPWGAEFTDIALEYLRHHFERVISRMIDSYIYFIDRAIRCVKPPGVIGFIVPSTLLNQVDAKPTRELLLKQGLTHLVSFGQGIFGTKVLNTSTVFITGDNKKAGFVVGNLSDLELQKRPSALLALTTKPWSDWKSLVEADPHRTFFVSASETTALLTKLRGSLPPLSESVNGSIQRGVSPDVASAHVISVAEAKKKKLEKDILRLSLSGPQIKRYGSWKPDQFIIYTGRDTPVRKFPNVFKFLEDHRHLNTCREVQEGKHPWWALHRPRDRQIFESPKFIGLTTTKTIEMIFDEHDNLFVTDAMYVFSLKPGLCPWAFMAAMQSKLFLFLYREANQGESRVIPQVKASKLDTIPFPVLQASMPKANALATLCKGMLAAKKQLAAAQSDADRDFCGNKCAGLDGQIDALVYELYGLTADEIKIVEGAAA
ncbi:MAG: N-6 DNA methylase [Verrucomicrobiia bacterium]